jgi:hypothetical protein
MGDTKMLKVTATVRKRFILFLQKSLGGTQKRPMGLMLVTVFPQALL